MEIAVIILINLSIVILKLKLTFIGIMSLLLLFGYFIKSRYSFVVCLRKLDDFENAQTAFERAEVLVRADPQHSSRPKKQPKSAEAVAQVEEQHFLQPLTPLVHLNFALFAYETKQIALANKQYSLFLTSSEDINQLPIEVRQCKLLI